MCKALLGGRPRYAVAQVLAAFLDLAVDIQYVSHGTGIRSLERAPHPLGPSK